MLEKLELYGTVRLKINEKAFATLSFNKNKISFFIYENEPFSKLLKSFGALLENSKGYRSKNWELKTKTLV